MFLGEMLDCNFKDSEYLSYFSRPGHFRFSSRVLRKSPFCQPHDEKLSFQEIIKRKLCINVKATELSKTCKELKVTVVKILEHRIMGRQIQSLKPLFETEAFLGKILYLVRDPRAVISSMYFGGWMTYVNAQKQMIFYTIKSEKFIWYVKRICGQIESNLKFIMRPERWLTGRVKVVRYEDLILEPEKNTRKIFKFVDLPFPVDMRQWLYNRTHFKEVLNSNIGTFSTRKNSTISMRKWRLKSPVEMVSLVEKHCSGVMDALGYLPSRGSREILARLDIPLVSRRLIRAGLR
ncbi:predicted protein [Nematostella vectensis]|uniref:Sulfotransferase domain-containing protein n=2 Tax=Nematostella vectensis TaxID=45351 RepID=A7RWZ7_NEMVE|nr:predicted protein [Nematostella vectensis]|eukprot:XP_001636124.1 predicted protein [Nematostella vectensis]